MFIQKMHAALDEAGYTAKDWEIRSLQAVGSTNNRVADMLGLYQKVIVLSEIQTQGRGRERREWFSPVGGLWMSIGFLTDAEPHELSGPIIQVIQEELSKYVECEVKDPNDILINGLKVCGILVETKIQSNRLKQVIIGIGINVTNEIPEEIETIATSLAEHRDELPSIQELGTQVSIRVLDKLRTFIPNL